MRLPLLSAGSGVKLAMEMIDFQLHDSFGSDLEMILSELQKKIIEKTYSSGSSIAESKEVRDIETLIFDRFGMKCKIQTNKLDAAILPFYSNRNHIFLNKFFRGNVSIKEQNSILKNANGKKGTVDLKKAKLGGIFSEYTNIVYMHFRNLFSEMKMSVPEVAAVLLHELGHGFYVCEYTDRLETTNQVLENAAKEITSKNDKKDLSYIYRELKSVNPKITEEETEKLLSGNKVIAGYTWFKVVVGTVEEQLLNCKYSETSFEQGADNFASRFNYGRELIQALDKLHTYYKTPEKNRGMNFYLSFSSLFSFVVFTVASAISVFTGVIPVALLYGLLAFLVFRVTGEDYKDYTYDELKIRYKRIRNESVNLLKDLDLPSDRVEVILEDIRIADRAIDEAFKFSSPLSKIANFIFTPARHAKASITEQQLMEELAFNDLFVHSAELRTM